MEPHRPDLTISIISADNLALLLPCLRSVFAATHGIALEVYVVDNASGDDTVATVRAEFPQVKTIRNTTRLGFSTNNNTVLERGRGRYLMLLNDDTEVLDGALDILVAFMDAHPQAGAVGSCLLNPDGTLQAAFARFPHPAIEAIWPATRWASRQLGRHDEPFEVDSVCGAAMLVRREVIDRVGMLDTAFDPIYSEEVDWCYRIKQSGWKVFTVPHARIIHHGSVTMNRALPRKYELLLSHKAFFFRKHMGKAADKLYRATLSLATAIKVVWYAALTVENRGHRERRDLHWYLLKRVPKL